METSDTLTSLEFILNILGFMPICGSECMEMRSWYERGQEAGAGPTVNEGKTRKWFRDGYLKRLGVVWNCV